MLGISFINGFVLGIEHEGFPEEDAWVISIYFGPLVLMFGRNVVFQTDTDE